MSGNALVGAVPAFLVREIALLLICGELPALWAFYGTCALSLFSRSFWIWGRLLLHLLEMAIWNQHCARYYDRGFYCRPRGKDYLANCLS